ncbi:segregation and condensation protein B [Rubidibacter lacunae KORDI 51-2]|uniref:Segregation and condensation protein B n=1 Tax=Rubidibacter lacunae KORDI 51-2 TaxID=582515 RepID=U5DQ59_9CHRO|nr:SMC-Scp complex subunit ScpB [Rubidibacter lacunae]ERN42987.1 segregation and condensation protein B [Rubidibacter lacunae KORDI 51-2]
MSNPSRTSSQPLKTQPPRLAARIEAVLYLVGQPLPLAEIAERAACDREAAAEALLELATDYTHRDSALEVVETPAGYGLQLRAVFQALLQDLVPSELGVGALRTLAAIALKSPLLQTELIDLRGSGAYQHVQELVQLGFVRKRRQSDGRSFWLEVSDKFHHYFEIDERTQVIGRAAPLPAEHSSVETGDRAD